VNASTTLAASTRRGRRATNVSSRVIKQLNRGRLETTNLTEVLAIDFAELLATTAPGLTRAAFVAMRLAAEEGVAHRMALAGQYLHDHFGPSAYLRFARHGSDTVRGWAAFILAATPHFTLGERLHLIRPLANDHNPGVREWAWLSLRPLIAADPVWAISLLEPWAVSTSPFLRRFTAEATRPRGALCNHIELLKRKPSLGLPVLEPLRADPHRYVQDSVGFWLHDAAKTQPEWVRELCARWMKESPLPATQRICRRAQRSLAS
jgi:3-methyladenine DNA glycosylase AlkC